MFSYRCTNHGSSLRITFAKEVTDSIRPGGEIRNLVQLLSWDDAEKNSSNRNKQKKCMRPPHKFSAKTLPSLTEADAHDERASKLTKLLQATEATQHLTFLYLLELQ